MMKVSLSLLCLSGFEVGSTLEVGRTLCSATLSSGPCVPVRRHVAPRLCANKEDEDKEEAKILPSIPLSSPVEEWTGVDVASGSALFLLLHTITQTAASAVGQPVAAVAFARVLSTTTFVGVQQVAGLPMASWLSREVVADTERDITQSPFAPVFACALFAAAAFAPAVGLTATGHAAEAHALLPGARPLPGFDGAFELLLAAPVTEEIVRLLSLSNPDGVLLGCLQAAGCSTSC